MKTPTRCYVYLAVTVAGSILLFNYMKSKPTK